MISSKNIFYHELIGLELKVVDSSNPSLIGLRGTVIDETKKTLTVEVSQKVHSKDLSSNQDLIFIYREKLIQKDVSVFQFKVPDGTIVEIDGKILLNRPEDRIKKRVEIDGKILLNRPEDRIKKRYKKI